MADRRKAAAAAAAAATGVAVVGGKLAKDKLAKRSRDARAFRLYKDEAVPDGIRRIARGQLDDASEELEGASKRKLGEAVHDARKRMKRLRATVRVARDALGDTTYARENAAYREAGQALSGARDSQVLRETLDSLAERYADELAPEAIAALRERLEAEQREATESLKADSAIIDGVVESLEVARKRTAGWNFEGGGFDALAPGLRRIYRRGRRRMRAAIAKPTNENLHEWRKRAKDHWHALQIVQPAAPKRLRKLAKRAHRLADLLGDDHDLAILRDYADLHPELFDDEATRAALASLIDRRRGELQREAFKLGRRLYKKRTKRFVRGLEQGWKTKSTP